MKAVTHPDERALKGRPLGRSAIRITTLAAVLGVAHVCDSPGCV